MLTNLIRKTTDWARRFLIKSGRAHAETERDLVRISALNASTQDILKDTSYAKTEAQGSNECAPIRPCDGHVDIEAELAKLKSDLVTEWRPPMQITINRGRDEGGGQFFLPAFPPDPDEPSHMPRSS